ncbi:MAG: methyltransferase domain-containing protein [Clostridia bacterium]
MNAPVLKYGERIDDLKYKSLRIIQNPNMYCFTEDSVLLSRFASLKPNERCIDFGTGSGAIALLINAHMGARVVGIDIQEDIIDMANRSKAMNDQDKVDFFTMDIRDAYKTFNGFFDAAVCNPPYFRGHSMSKNESRCLSTHLSDLSIIDICLAMKRVLKFGARCYFVYPVSELSDIFDALRKNSFEIKRLTLIRASEAANPRVALIMAKLGGNVGMIVENKIAREILI